ncbi:MAG: thioredoxin family protein [Deltaproteobacteria bacterium]|nr:thioredoxin family protein [Deltaproteobacteria bacterium]
MFKTKRIIWVLGLILCLSGSVAAGAAQEAWLSDFASARDLAGKEKKFLLIDFTGSDWCSWCKKLDQEVFSRDIFLKESAKNFVLVKLDFPQQSQLDEKLTLQNQALSKTYEISGFPSIILADAAGVEFARTGYQPGGPEAYLAMLEGFISNFRRSLQLQSEAAALTGVARAEKLDQAVDLLVQNGSRSGYQNLADEIISLDGDGRAGLRPKYELPQKLTEIESRLNQDKDFDRAVADLNQLVPSAAKVPTLLQQVYLFQAGILIKGKGDKRGGLEKLVLAQKSAPETKTGRQLVKFIERLQEEKEEVPARNHEASAASAEAR